MTYAWIMASALLAGSTAQAAGQGGPPPPPSLTFTTPVELAWVDARLHCESLARPPETPWRLPTDHELRQLSLPATQFVGERPGAAALDRPFWTDTVTVETRACNGCGDPDALSHKVFGQTLNPRSLARTTTLMRACRSGDQADTEECLQWNGPSAVLTATGAVERRPQVAFVEAAAPATQPAAVCIRDDFHYVPEAETIDTRTYYVDVALSIPAQLTYQEKVQRLPRLRQACGNGPETAPSGLHTGCGAPHAVGSACVKSYPGVCAMLPSPTNATGDLCVCLPDCHRYGRGMCL
jgi:hypothetical protein